MSLCYNDSMRKTSSHTGFTMVELSLSLTFVAVLSIAVVVIMTNAISSYHRGIILNQINTTGMELVDDMRGSIQSASARSVVSECASIYSDDKMVEACQKDRAKNFVSVIRQAAVKVGNKNITAPVFGAFCTGNYSYIWNSGYFYTGNNAVGVDASINKAAFKYRRPGNTNAVNWPNDIKLLKVKDENRSICISAVKNEYKIGPSGIGNVFDISDGGYNAIDEEPVELLVGDSGLAIYDLDSSAPAESTALNSMFYSATFILGTVQGGINVMASGDFCAVPGDLANGSIEEFNYCAINKFNFAAEANGG